MPSSPSSPLSAGSKSPGPISAANAPRVSSPLNPSSSPLASSAELASIASAASTSDSTPTASPKITFAHPAVDASAQGGASAALPTTSVVVNAAWQSFSRPRGHSVPDTSKIQPHLRRASVRTSGTGVGMTSSSSPLAAESFANPYSRVISSASSGPSVSSPNLGHAYHRHPSTSVSSLFGGIDDFGGAHDESLSSTFRSRSRSPARRAPAAITTPGQSGPAPGHAPYHASSVDTVASEEESFWHSLFGGNAKSFSKAASRTVPLPSLSPHASPPASPPIPSASFPGSGSKWWTRGDRSPRPWAVHRPLSPPDRAGVAAHMQRRRSSSVASSEMAPASPEMALASFPTAYPQQPQVQQHLPVAVQAYHVPGTHQVSSIVPAEQTDGWEWTRQRVSKAALSVLGVTADVTHELLAVGTDLLEFVPVPGLANAARVLLNIWDAVQLVDMNRLACLRLTERCANILFSVRQEVQEAGNEVTEELQAPIEKLVHAFMTVYAFMQKQKDRPWLKRYLKRDEIRQSVAGCDAELTEALKMFGLSIQIRILKQVQESERRRGADTWLMLSELLAAVDGVRRMLATSGGRIGDQPMVIKSGTVERLDASSYNGGQLLEAGLHASVETVRPLRPPSAPTSADMATFPIPMSTSPTRTEEHDRADVIEAETTEDAAATAHLSPMSTATFPPSPSSLTQVLPVLTTVHRLQNERDEALDTEDLRNLMRNALAAGNDVEMMRILGVARDEMPDAVKTLQRALERLRNRLSLSGSGSGSALASGTGEAAVATETSSGVGLGMTGVETSSASQSSLPSSGSGASIVQEQRRDDALDEEFIELGIDALRRMSSAVRGGGHVELELPSWTITKYEIDREGKIGFGFFSDVYKGTWHGRTVAIKVLAESTPRELFVKEVSIWKSLPKHPNVLEVYGASSAAGDPPWFIVGPYLPNGNLVDWLRGVEERMKRASASLGVGMGAVASQGLGLGVVPGIEKREVDLWRFMLEIANGMAFLHSNGVLHGDLKASNVLVDDRIHCVIMDFGQSEMKSEAYRISGTLPPKGTLRWQAPELMAGSGRLTQEMDVYAYAITCVEILGMGKLPWRWMDDEAVRSIVIRENGRPPIPTSPFTIPAIQDLIKLCWEREPTIRPSFERILRELAVIREREKVIAPGEDTISPHSAYPSQFSGSLPRSTFSSTFSSTSSPGSMTPLHGFSSMYSPASNSSPRLLPHSSTSLPAVQESQSEHSNWWDEGRTRPSPDMRPIPLLGSGSGTTPPPQDPSVLGTMPDSIGTGSDTNTASYLTARESALSAQGQHRLSSDPVPSSLYYEQLERQASEGNRMSSITAPPALQGDEDVDSLSVSPGSHWEDTVSSSRMKMPEPVIYTPSNSIGPSRSSSLKTDTTPSSQSDIVFVSSASGHGDGAVAVTASEVNVGGVFGGLLIGPGDGGSGGRGRYGGYDSPPPADERIAELKNERRYRLMMRQNHDFHPSLTLPLWDPSPIDLGAVGYLSKPRGAFITLFNAFRPEQSSSGLMGGMPSIHGYGHVKTGFQRQDRRSAAQRSLDAFVGWLTFRSKDKIEVTGHGHHGRTVSKSVSRRYSFPLKGGHKTAVMYTEATMYHYMESLDAPKGWFKANMDRILKVYGPLHRIQKDDLYLVIGKLDAQNYGLFVSHNHPDGLAHFNVYSSPKTGQPWGTFTADMEAHHDVAGPSYDEPVLGHQLSASKVSNYGGHWDTVLLARLRFKPDVPEPTSL